jgi:hypothetical protein
MPVPVVKLFLMMRLTGGFSMGQKTGEFEAVQ